MYGESVFMASNKKQDQQVPESGVDPVPLLEEILTHEQNTCIQIRDTCTMMAQSVRDVLGSSMPQGGYVQAMQDKLGQLEKAVNSLETTIKRKSVFSNDFLDSASQRWFEKRLSSQSRKRRLRNFKRKDGGAHASSGDSSPPSTPTQYTFMPFDGNTQFQSGPPTPSSPPLHSSVPSPSTNRPFIPPLPSLTVPSTSPNNSPRGRNRVSPSDCVPSTPSYSSSSSTPTNYSPSTPSYSSSSSSTPKAKNNPSQFFYQPQSMSISNIIN